MKIKTLKLFYLSICITSIISCSKEENINKGPTVYVLGENGYDSVLWKNMVVTGLNSEVNSLYVAGEDVYVAGNIYNGDYTCAVVLKNGVISYLTDGTKYANALSVFVSDSVVYTVGYENYHVAMLWKNGVGTNLTSGKYYACANSVYVSGSDVYVAGYESNGVKNVAKLWKNGVVVNMTDGSNDACSNSVFVSGNDVYVAGYESNGIKDVAKFWKNGVAAILTDGKKFASANSVFVSGNDVYLAGYESSVKDSPIVNEHGIAKLWKNGVAVNLTDSDRFYVANSVYVFQNDVYVAAYGQNLTSCEALLWKNGITTILSDKYGSKANSVFVK